jgi:hypothetical protein
LAFDLNENGDHARPCERICSEGTRKPRGRQGCAHACAGATTTCLRSVLRVVGGGARSRDADARDRRPARRIAGGKTFFRIQLNVVADRVLAGVRRSWLWALARSAGDFVGHGRLRSIVTWDAIMKNSSHGTISPRVVPAISSIDPGTPASAPTLRPEEAGAFARAERRHA